MKRTVKKLMLLLWGVTKEVRHSVIAVHIEIAQLLALRSPFVCNLFQKRETRSHVVQGWPHHVQLKRCDKACTLTSIQTHTLTYKDTRAFTSVAHIDGANQEVLSLETVKRRAERERERNDRGLSIAGSMGRDNQHSASVFASSVDELKEGVECREAASLVYFSFPLKAMSAVCVGG